MNWIQNELNSVGVKMNWIQKELNSLSVEMNWIQNEWIELNFAITGWKGYTMTFYYSPEWMHLKQLELSQRAILEPDNTAIYPQIEVFMLFCQNHVSLGDYNFGPKLRKYNFKYTIWV